MTGVWDVLNFVAVDDCGVRINPMIVEGQIMGGLTEAYAMANMQFITFDAEGDCVGSNYMDYLLPTAWETSHPRPWLVRCLRGLRAFGATASPGILMVGVAPCARCVQIAKGAQR